MSTLAKAAEHRIPDLKNPRLFRQQCYIDGAWLDAESGKTIEVINPASRDLLGTVPDMGETETRRALEAANRALRAWRARTARERSSLLPHWSDLLKMHHVYLERHLSTLHATP